MRANIYGPLDTGMVVYTATLSMEVLTQRNFVSDFIRSKWTFNPKNEKKSLFEPPFLDLEVAYALHL